MKNLRFSIILSILILSAISSSFGSETLKKVSGDRQSAIAGNPLGEDFVLQARDQNGGPIENLPVVFSVIKSGKQTISADPQTFLSSPVVLTDSEGFARTRLNLGPKERGEIFVSAETKGTLGKPEVFVVSAKSKIWMLILLLGVIGGLGIFLFGMFFLNEALQKISGQKLKDLLRKFTNSPWKGMGTGFFVTLLNQSSSATTMLEVSLVSAGIMTFYQSLSVTMGAEIGSTITAQLIAFRLADYAVFISGAGFFVSFFSKTKKWKNIGNAVLGFGLLFVGMKVMIDILAPLADYGNLTQKMSAIDNPFLGIIAGLLFTMVVQSSGATAGIVIALAMAGAITLNQAVPLNLGAQIGTCFTALLCSIGRPRESKRVAYWHVIHQTAGVILVLPFITIVNIGGEPAWYHFVKEFTRVFLFTTDTSRQIAMSHTLLAVLAALLFLPLLPLMHKLFLFLFPSREEERPFGTIYIDDGLLENPPLALEQAKKEIVREGRIVLDMFSESLKVFENLDQRLAETVSLKDFKADLLRKKIVTYLSKIAQNPLTEEQSLKETQLLYITADFEGIGDIVDNNILPMALKKIKNELWFSDAGWNEIVGLHAKIYNNLSAVISALENNSIEEAKAVWDSKIEINAFESELRRRHIERLNTGMKESHETSSVHLDLIGQFKRINSIVIGISLIMLKGAGDKQRIN